MKKMMLIKDSNGGIIGIAKNKKTADLYKEEGYTLIPVNILDRREKIPVNKAMFYVLSVCRDGYECAGEKIKKKGTIIELIEEFFYAKLSETKKENYIPFTDFIDKAYDNNKEEGWIGSSSIALLARMFYSSIRTLTQELECLSKDKDITELDIINYLSSLYIDNNYIKDYGYKEFLAMR